LEEKGGVQKFGKKELLIDTEFAKRNQASNDVREEPRARRETPNQRVHRKANISIRNKGEGLGREKPKNKNGKNRGADPTARVCTRIECKKTGRGEDRKGRTRGLGTGKRKKLGGGAPVHEGNNSLGDQTFSKMEEGFDGGKQRITLGKKTKGIYRAFGQPLTGSGGIGRV